MARITEALSEEFEVTFFFAPEPHAHDAIVHATGPAPDGVRVVVLRHSQTRGSVLAHWWAPLHERLLSLGSSSLPSFGRAWLNDGVMSRLDGLREQEFDLVWAAQLWAGEAALAAGFARVVVDVNDLPSEWLGRRLAETDWYRTRWLHRLEVAKIARYERSLARRFRGVAVCKEEDGKGIDGPVVVVPNGVDIVPALQSIEQPATILFVGMMSYEPNADAVRHLLDDIIPLVRSSVPEVRVVVAGRNPPPDIVGRGGLGIEIAGYVDDIAVLYAEATVVVAPIRTGGGTRIKVLEALARRKALVATSVAAEGLRLQAEVDLSLADRVEDFAAECVRLIRSPSHRQELARRGAATVRELYDWKVIGEQVRALAKSVISESPQGEWTEGHRTLGARGNGRNRGRG